MKPALLTKVIAMSKFFAYMAMVQAFFLTVINAHPSYGQKLDETIISCDWNKHALQDAFLDIQRQTDLFFTYTFETIENISISNTNESLTVADMLKFISGETGLHFKIVEELIYVFEGQREITKRQLVEIPEIGEVPNFLDGLGYAIIYEVSTNKLGNEVTISGTVTDENGQPLIGATVLVRETGQGTITDENGQFLVQVPEDAPFTLSISYIGFQTSTLVLEAPQEINVALQSAFTKLNEVVVIGYTSAKPKDFTGSIASIESNRISQLPVNGIEQALQGQIAGVQVTNEGAPGGAVSVRIRGYGTIGNNDPLYIIDGVPTKTSLNQFAVSDIENIQILKDASATAIYGSRAANGVVIINTRKGSSGKPKFEFNSNLSVQQPINLPDMLNTNQYADLLWQAQRNAGIVPANDLFGNGESPQIPDLIDQEQIIPASVPGTDWFDETFNNGLLQNYSLSIQSGKEGIRNYTSLSYLDQEGIMQFTGFKKYTFRTNTSLNIGRLTFGENLSLSVTNTQSVPTNQALGSRMIHTYRINPVVPVFDINGNYAGPVNGVQGALNPIGLNYLDRNDRTMNNRVFGNLFAELEIIKGLSLKSTLGLDYSDINTKDYDPKYKMGITERGETIFFQSEASQLQLLFNNILQYKILTGDHRLTAVLGQEAIRYTFNEVGGVSSNFITDEIEFIQLNTGSGQSSNFSNGTEWALLSYFGRLDYQFQGKYLLGASIRRDGSSRFSEANRYSIFPAFSAGWRLSEEPFLRGVRAINNLKLRTSYGQSGNQEIGDFPSFSTFSSDAWDTFYAIDGSNSQAAIGFKPTRIGNPAIKWETTTQTNFGLDAQLFGGLTLNLDYFIKNTDDILLQRPTLAIEGQADAPFVNLGKMKNQGLEVNMGYAFSPTQHLNISVQGNFSIIRNEVVQLADDVVELNGLVDNTYSRDLVLSVTRAGLPISQFYGHVVEGIFSSQQAVMAHAEQEGKGIGRFRFADLNEDGVIDDRDKTIIGNPHPDFMYGFSFNANYKGLDLSVLIHGVYGVDLYNFTRYYTDFYYDLGNRHTRILDAWSPGNTNATIPLISAVDSNNELRPSTYFIEDGSFLRLKNLQVGYTLPLSGEEEKSLRIYVQAQNLFTLTNYEGIDPEVGLVNAFSENRNLDIGVDRGIYPNARIFSAGLTLKL